MISFPLFEKLPLNLIGIEALNQFPGPSIGRHIHTTGPRVSAIGERV